MRVLELLEEIEEIVGYSGRIPAYRKSYPRWTLRNYWR